MVIGTAGHVDHGKTRLVSALTGIDTDRLQEEKKRGITIELGFAWMDLPGGNRVGLVDVPGHERLIHNMLAGAGGIDLALLVVAADDGVMPQTREHLGILSLLGIPDGMVALTKSDLAQSEWMELVEEDIRKMVAGTFLADAPIMRVSAQTGEGLEELKAEIAQRAEAVEVRRTDAPARLPVDRVFSVEGFGTVVTGTLMEGALRVGDEVELYPSQKRCRVRSLQVHSQDVETAFAGQRVAVNLAGLDRHSVRRGDVLAAVGSMEPALMLDVKLQVLPDSGRVVADGSRVHFYHGAGESLCKVALLDREKLAPGQEGYAQLRFTRPVAAKGGDRFVIRFYSPLETIGGGVVLHPNPVRHRRYQDAVLEGLKVREEGIPRELLLQEIADGSARFVSFPEIGRRLGMSEEALAQELEALEQEGRAVRLDDHHGVSRSYLVFMGEKAQGLLETYHEKNPLQAGMRRDELRSRLLPGREMVLTDKVLERLAAEGVLRLDDRIAALPGFQVQHSEDTRALAEAIEGAFREEGYRPPSLEEIQDRYARDKSIKAVVEAMLASGVLVGTGSGILFHSSILKDAREKLETATQKEGGVTLGQFRDMTGTSRRFALSLLEYFDRHGVTKKVGDARILAKK